MKKHYLFILTFLFFFSFSFSQTTYYVATSANGGNDSNNGTTEATPMLTLAAAVSASSSGDTINVGPGTFSSECNILANKPLTIQGHGRDETIFDGSSGNSSCGFMAITANVTVQNMTIQDYATSVNGSYFRFNSAGINIGGVRGTEYTTSSPLQVYLRNIKFYNIASSGSGNYGGAITTVSNYNGTNHAIYILQCIFMDNEASSWGGALATADGVSVVIQNSFFTDNKAAGGGAIFFADWNASGGSNIMYFYNSTMWRNYATSGGSLGSGNYNSGGISTYTSAGEYIYLYVKNSVIAYNKVSGVSGSYYYDVMPYNTSANSQQVFNFAKTQTYSIYEPWMDTYDSFTGSNEIYEGENSYGALYIDWDDDKRWKFTSPSSSLIGQADAYATSIDINGVTRPQGSGSDIGAFEYRNTWDGSSSTDWGTAANWSLNTVPSTTSAYDAPIIEDVTNDPVISTDVEIDNLKIREGGSLTIQKTGSLKLTEHLIQNGTLTMQSDSDQFSSLIVEGNSYGEVKHHYNSGNFGDNGSYSGDITYERYIADEGSNEWDFIGSPVEGQTMSSFVSANSALADSGAQYAIGEFSNDGGTDTAAAMYTNYTSDGTGAGNVSANSFVMGKGYSMATDEDQGDGTTLSFTGNVKTNNLAAYTIDDNSANLTNYGKFNLVSNPFPSFLNANDDAHGSNNFLTVNASNLHTSYAAIYAYDGDGTFTAINHTDPGSAVYIAPGQAFFLASDDVAGNTVSFTEAMQTNGGGDDFISGDNMDNTEVVIKLFNGDNELESTKIYFEEGLSDGLDVGYDAGNFHAEAPIMTRLVEEDEGYGMVINAMGLDAMENAVIPLVINQSAGQEFRVNLHTATIPDPNVYLEDVEEGTFTNLYEGDFVMTPTSDLEGVGRFFIHMSADTMSNEDVSTSLLNAYKEVDASFITIEGLATQTNETKVSLYNILGREVFSTTLNNNMNTQTISTVGMASGIYVIELESGSDRLTKKLIIQ